MSTGGDACCESYELIRRLRECRVMSSADLRPRAAALAASDGDPDAARPPDFRARAAAARTEFDAGNDLRPARVALGAQADLDVGLLWPGQVGGTVPGSPRHGHMTDWDGPSRAAV